MYILGIDCYYHDSAACLIKDGAVVAAAEEERFTRRKHDNSFPINAVNYCLQSQGLDVSDLAYIAFYEKPFLKFERVLSQHIEAFPLSVKTFISSMPSWINEKLRVVRAIKKKLRYKKGILFVEHHLAHAASAFLVSPYDDAAILTVDGVGEWTTTAYGHGQGSRIDLFKEIRFPHSLGLLYSTITAYLGFSVNNSEYKVMGLSAYGDTNRVTNPYYEKLKSVMRVKEDGSYKMDLSYFAYHYADRMPSEKLCDMLGGPINPRGGSINDRHKDIAAALQMVTEDVVTKMLCHLHDVTKCDKLVMAGGVALNSVYNGKILHSTPFKEIWIQPNASDGGTSMGAASYVYHSVLGHERNYVLTSAYLGPGYTSEEIKHYLDSNSIKYTQFSSDDEIIRKTATLVANNNVVGWFQGRMEWGPRALGARSILANPCNPRMQEILNEKVKHREKFRPFAPVVCAEDASTYFDCDAPVPAPADYMLMVYPIKQKFHSQIPSVTHVDGSGRLQTVRKHQNARYYGVIKAFGEITGMPMLINTSYNIRGEPIVCSPADAYRCMMGTGIDCLMMDKYLIKREDNPKDMWDSESLAND